MKKITIKSALLRIVAVLLLTLGTVSASAQYYMNIYPKNGQKTHWGRFSLRRFSFIGQY